MQQDFDIIIVGGGMAGTALACALGNTGYRIALYEGGDYDIQRPQADAGVDAYDTRVSALSPASRELLQSLGAWSRMEALRVGPYSRMQVWDGEGTGAVEFDAALVQRRWLGHIVENRVSVWALRQCLLEHDNVVTRGACKVVQVLPAECADAQHGEPTCSLLLSDGSRVRASLVVAADGALSLIRKMAQFDTREWDYGHIATVATVKVAQPHQQAARQRFLPEGPLAFLPLPSVTEPGHYCSIVWSAKPELAGNLAALKSQDFCQVLSRAFEERLGAVEQVGPRAAYPLRQRHAVSYYKPGLALVGDAAHTVHPLAGQGINLGFKDVAVLAQELSRADKLGLAPGATSVLSRYQRRRMADNLGMMAVLDGFKHLFGERDLTVRWLRNEGMHRFNRARWVKQQVMRRAMGV